MGVVRARAIDKNLTKNFFEKSIDKALSMCYTIIVPRGESEEVSRGVNTQGASKATRFNKIGAAVLRVVITKISLSARQGLTAMGGRT